MSTGTDVSERTQAIQGWVRRLRDGDESARGELLKLACDRLMELTSRMKRDFQRVGRWEQTEDVFQRASLRLYQALETVELNDAEHFLRLAALQIRRELVDLARKYDGPQGMGAHHFTQGAARPSEGNGERQSMAFDPAELTGDASAVHEWGEFHELIEKLPEQEQAVVDLLWYHGLTQEEAAATLNTSTRSVKRLWRSARLQLFEQLGGRLPGM